MSLSWAPSRMPCKACWTGEPLSSVVLVHHMEPLYMGTALCRLAPSWCVSTGHLK